MPGEADASGPDDAALRWLLADSGLTLPEDAIAGVLRAARRLAGLARDLRALPLETTEPATVFRVDPRR